MSEDNKSNSLLGAAVAAPTIGTAAYAFGKSISDTTFPKKSAIQRSVEKAISAPPPDFVSMSDHLSWMNRQSTFFSTEKGLAATNEAWRQALRGADPLTKKAVDIGDFKGASEVLETMRGMMDKTQRSTYTDRLFGSFRRNLEALTGQPSFYDEALTDKPARFITPTIPRAGQRLNMATVPKGIRSRAVAYEKMGARGFKFTAFRSPGFQEQGLGAYRMMFDVQGLNVDLHIPVSRKGVMAVGATSQTKRIAPDVVIYNPESKQFRRMTRTSFYMEAFEKNVLADIMEGKLKSQHEVNKAIKALNSEVITKMQALRNVPANLMAPGADVYENIRRQTVDVLIERERGKSRAKYFSRFRPPAEGEIEDVLKATGLKVGTSPKNIAAGRFTEFDFAKFSMTPSATDYSRRVEQGVREWQSSPTAQSAMMSSGKRRRWGQAFETLEFREARGKTAAPHMRTLYVDPSKHAQALEGVGIVEGESLVSTRLRKALDVQRVGVEHLKSVREGLSESIEKGTLKYGDVLGFTEAGEAIKHRRGMSLLGLSFHKTQGRGDYASLHFMERYRMRDAEKFFGDWKGMGKFLFPESIKEKARTLTDNAALHASNVEAIVSMDELRKNKSLHNKQMISELWEVMNQRSNVSELRKNAKLRSFMRNPRALASLLEQQSLTALGAGKTVYDTAAHERFVQKMMKFALETGKVAPAEFGSIFGAVPAVLGAEKATSLVEGLGYAPGIIGDYTTEMNKGISGGISQVFFGKTKAETGAGGLGSMEPRAYGLLRAGQYGEFGEDIADEFARRTAMTNPRKVAAHLELSKVLRSVSGDVGFAKGLATLDVSKASAMDFHKFAAKGGMMQLGKGLPSVYMPSPDVLDLMRPFETASGKMISGEISKEYQNLFHLGTRLHGDLDPVSKNEVNKALKEFSSFIHQHQAPGGKGAGGLLRGEMLGSALLTGVSASPEDWVPPDIHTVGVPKHQVERMLQQMKQAGYYSSEVADQMMKRFEQGEAVGGMVARHPTIGPYSLQPVKMEMAYEADNLMYLPSKSVDIGFKGVPGSHTIQMSPLVGMAGDLDADTFSISMVSPDNERKVLKALEATDDGFKNRYMQHSVRMQLLKARKAGDVASEMSTIATMAADARKLGATQTWVPKVSTELSKARQAVQSFSRGRASADAMFLLEWLEQTPISAKHLSAADVGKGKLATSMQTIVSSLQEKNAERLYQGVQSIVSQDELAQDLLHRRLVIEKGYDEISKITGTKAARNIEGLNISKTIQEVMNSLSASEKSGATRTAEILGGKGQQLRQLEIPIATKLARQMSMHGTFAGVSRMASTAKNMLMGTAAAISRHHKVVGFGFAGSLAVAAALSSPIEVVGGGASLLPGDKQASGNINVNRGQGRVTDETVMPPQQVMGNPTTSSPIPTPRAMITPGSRVDIDARSSRDISTTALQSGLSQASGGSHHININVRDNRTKINPHILINSIL